MKWKVVFAVILVLLVVGAVATVKGISITSNKVYVGFDEKFVNWLPGKYIGRITTLKVDINGNGNPEDDPNLYLGDLTGCETGTAVALSLNNSNSWITVNSVLYRSYGENVDIVPYGKSRLKIMRYISKLKLKISEEYNVSNTLPVVFVNVNVSGLSPDVSRIVYPIWFISHVWVTSNPGETKYVKTLKFSDTDVLSFTPRELKNAVNTYRLHIVKPYTHISWPEEGYAISVEDTNSSWVAMEINKGYMHYVLGFVALSHVEGFIAFKRSVWPHHTMIGAVVYDRNIGKSTLTSIHAKFAIVYAKNYTEFSKIARKLLKLNTPRSNSATNLPIFNETIMGVLISSLVAYIAYTYNKAKVMKRKDYENKKRQLISRMDRLTRR